MRTAAMLRNTSQNYMRLLKKSDNVDRWIQYIYESKIWPAAMEGCVGISTEIECSNKELLEEIKHKFKKVFSITFNILRIGTQYSLVEINWGENRDQE